MGIFIIYIIVLMMIRQHSELDFFFSSFRVKEFANAGCIYITIDQSQNEKVIIH